MNPLSELRDRLKLSRVEFGELVNKSEATIEKYESGLSPRFANQLANLAKKHGHPDLAKLFKIAAGKDSPPDGLDMKALAPDEIDFLQGCLKIYRNRKDNYYGSVVTIVRESIKLRHADDP